MEVSMEIPDFDQIWWLSIVAAIMPFTYSVIGLSLGIAQTICMFTAWFHPITWKKNIAISFWPLTVYFPVEMYIAQRGVPHGSVQWIFLKTLSLACLVVSIAATLSSIADVIDALKVYRPFSG
ncbi:hypothetical protein ABZP36_034364 [Zizania latifolia]